MQYCASQKPGSASSQVPIILDSAIVVELSGCRSCRGGSLASTRWVLGCQRSDLYKSKVLWRRGCDTVHHCVNCFLSLITCLIEGLQIVWLLARRRRRKRLRWIWRSRYGFLLDHHTVVSTCGCRSQKKVLWLLLL